MITAVDPFNVTEYIPWDERHLEAKDQTKFLIQYPDLNIMEKIDNDSIEFVQKGDKTSHRITTGTQKTSLLRACIKGWVNFKDGKGHDVGFDGSSPEERDRSLSKIPPGIRDELTNELRGLGDANKAARERHVERMKESGREVKAA